MSTLRKNGGSRENGFSAAHTLGQVPGAAQVGLGIPAAATVVSHGLWFELEMRLTIVPVIVLLASALYAESMCVLKSN